MKKAAIALLTATALLAGPAVQAKQRMTGEEKLAKLLEGREKAAAIRRARKLERKRMERDGI